MKVKHSKNILLLITKGTVGGAQMSVYHLAVYLKNKGHQVTVACGDGDFLPQKLDEVGIPCRQFSNLKRSINPLVMYTFISQFRLFLIENQFDILHINSSNALFGAISAKRLSCGPKVVFTFRGLSVLDPNYETHPLIRKTIVPLFRWLLSYVDAQVYVSNSNAAIAQKLHITSNESVILNGLPIEKLSFFQKADARMALFEQIPIRDTGQTIIGTIGRLSYQKDIPFLITNVSKILTHRKDAICIIIGDGPDRMICQKAIATSATPSQIFLIGEIPEAYQYLCGFDIFSLTSRYEGLSIGLIEVLAAGLPIIASAVSGNTDVLKDVGLLYPLYESSTYQNKLERLIKTPSLRRSLSKKALTAAKIYDITYTGKAYEKLYSTLDV